MDISSRLKQVAVEAIEVRSGRVRVKWPEAIRSEILWLLESGESIESLSQATKISPATIVFWRDSRKQKGKFKEIKFTPETTTTTTAATPPSCRPQVRLKARGIEIFVDLARDDLADLIKQVLR